MHSSARFLVKSTRLPTGLGLASMNSAGLSAYSVETGPRVSSRPGRLAQRRVARPRASHRGPERRDFTSPVVSPLAYRDEVPVAPESARPVLWRTPPVVDDLR